MSATNEDINDILDNFNWIEPINERDKKLIINYLIIGEKGKAAEKAGFKKESFYVYRLFYKEHIRVNLLALQDQILKIHSANLTEHLAFLSNTIINDTMEIEDFKSENNKIVQYKGRKTIPLKDKFKALELLNKMLGRETTEVTVNHINKNTEDLKDMTDKEIAIEYQKIVKGE
jgi:hypothetical protein